MLYYKVFIISTKMLKNIKIYNIFSFMINKSSKKITFKQLIIIFSICIFGIIAQLFFFITRPDLIFVGRAGYTIMTPVIILIIMWMVWLKYKGRI